MKDMLGALRKLDVYLAAKTFDDLRSDELLQDAVIRQLTVLGEAAARVSPETRARDAGIPWRSIVGLRNVVVHVYDDINLDELWRTVHGPVPELRARLETLLLVIQGEPTVGENA